MPRYIKEKGVFGSLGGSVRSGAGGNDQGRENRSLGHFPIRLSDTTLLVQIIKGISAELRFPLHVLFPGGR